MKTGKEERRLAAIMFTDMVGYSALTQRNEALEHKSPLAMELQFDPVWDKLRPDARFTALLRKVGLRK